jgi:hypothetical protein
MKLGVREIFFGAVFAGLLGRTIYKKYKQKRKEKKPPKFQSMFTEHESVKEKHIN